VDPLIEILSFDAPSFIAGSFRVDSIVGEEALSEPFRFEISALAVDLEADVVEEQTIGRPGRLQIVDHNGEHHSILGVIRSVRFEGVESPTVQRFRLELVPPLWVIGERVRSRIFQDQTVQQIVTHILDELHVLFDFRLTKEYAEREYCVQYRESDVDFISRILAEEGIFFYFRSADGPASVMVFGDATSSYRTLTSQEDAIRFFNGVDTGLGEHVATFVVQRDVRAGSVMLRDYDFRKPNLDLTAQVVVPQPGRPDSPGALEHYEHPGGYLDSNVGTALARLRLQEARWDAFKGFGSGNVRRFSAGLVFALVDHPVERLNRQWVVSRLRHEGRTQGLTAGGFIYRSTFECVHADEVFRPRRFAKPDVRGIETARVTGSDESEEIRVDDLGRIKVRFYWDRDGEPDPRSSCFIRVGQTWSGTGFGFWFLPRVGMEVIVSFIGGDPDQPLVTGCVYNGAHPLPYKMPDHKTRSTIRTLSSPGGDGFNEIRFEDLAKQEQIFIHAQRDLDEKVNRNHTEAVGADEAISIGHDQTIDVARRQKTHVGEQQFITVDADRWVEVHGGEAIIVDQARNELVSGAEKVTIKGNRDHTAELQDSLTVGTDRWVTIGGADVLAADEKQDDIATKYSVTVGTRFKLTSSNAEVKCDDDFHATAIASTVEAKAHLQLTGKTSCLKGTDDLMLESEKKITLKVGGSTITIEPSGVTVDADEFSVFADSVTIHAPAINVKATGHLKLEGTAEVDVEGAVIKLNV
jgi:type VI secretion system secreted protein VgrG